MKDGLTWEAITAIATVLGVLLTALAAVGVSLLGAIFKKLGQLGEAFATQQAHLTSFVDRCKDHRDAEHDTHKRLWATVEDHGRKLDDHERRISAFEG